MIALRGLGVLVLVAGWAVSSSAAEPEAAVPPALQAAILKKVLGYDRALEGKSEPRVLVVHDRSSAAVAAELEREFELIGVRARSCDAEAAQKTPLDPATVVYLAAPPSPALLEAIAGARALSVSGSPDLVERGQASVGLRRKPDGRTEILIHLGRALAEHHDFSSYLLTISTLVK